VFGYWNNTPWGEPGSYRTWLGINKTIGACAPAHFFVGIGMFERLSWSNNYKFCAVNDCSSTVTLNTTNYLMDIFETSFHCKNQVPFDYCPDAKDKPW